MNRAAAQTRLCTYAPVRPLRRLSQSSRDGSE
jgi:hypothetical protein